ncbi:hypothetical protein C500_02125 [Natrialba magadii ATCC 43099]|uniref:Uncharacterized protein n=1 Tax=Natrialba magadii (strain ATCC 43099 / DSM 3394 / CCM 3739 / CIP 104546 / IAM 13178 / JCM 8861 / NBRC 102185 / NCIMB 2190 / MS3) TaxID=547559 RepID=L9V9F4_NATMM|nr:hypothetical protein [Natrialba magadii]ELY33591.1 hypothetical protein C500_02125 [Natrialba magadii ATCC 43099]
MLGIGNGVALELELELKLEFEFEFELDGVLESLFRWCFVWHVWHVRGVWRAVRLRRRVVADSGLV